MQTQSIIKSPMNYVGGKTKLLPQLLPLFPQKINTFIDLFAGGCNVGINVKANKIICNDINAEQIELYKFIQQHDINIIITQIRNIIATYELSLTNKNGFIKLRNDYNSQKTPLMLFALLCYSFNHQYRVNKKGEYNTSFGENRHHFNKSIETNLIKFSNIIKANNIEFYSYNFLSFDYTTIKESDFIYLDPPYTISFANYNALWDIDNDKKLSEILDKLSNKGISFRMSNVLEHKGVKNEFLIEWAKKYKIFEISKTYKNSNYHKKQENKTLPTREVYICNY